MTPKTLVDKIWDAHVVRSRSGEPDLLYVDLHLVHEVTSPQAFDGLRLHHRRVRRPDLTFATLDHNVPTTPRSEPVTDPVSRLQIDALERNAKEFGIRLEGMLSQRQGIVHIIGPELGLTQPGMLIVCGDSHTATHGALGALAFGIGTTEVEHVLASQILPQPRPRTMEVRVDGDLPLGTTPKDLILGVIAATVSRCRTGRSTPLAANGSDCSVTPGRFALARRSRSRAARPRLPTVPRSGRAMSTSRPGSVCG